MIYLIITTSINNKYGNQDDIERKNRYLYAISETLKNVPYEIKPIVVENNGLRETYLDNFYHHQQQHVKVFYTENNKLNFKSKGINEFMDIKEVIERYGIEDDDIIIKLTGRYRMLSTSFFDTVIKDEKKYDAFVKFYGTCSLKFEQYDCILGCYAIRATYLRLFNPLTINNYKSAEIAFAKYVRLCRAKIKEIDKLDVECSFSDDLRLLNV
jgi:hypothetical protein